jgi:hypothetical protein
MSPSALLHACRMIFKPRRRATASGESPEKVRDIQRKQMVMMQLTQSLRNTRRDGRNSS